MPINAKTVAASAALAFVAAVGFIISGGNGVSVKEAAATGASLRMVYALNGLPVLELLDGGAALLNEFPCAYRPKGVDDCRRVCAPSKQLSRCLDGGMEAPINATMQHGEWAGDDCVRRSCVVMAGEKDGP